MRTANLNGVREEGRGVFYDVASMCSKRRYVSES
jgi:hypothetical protein